MKFAEEEKKFDETKKNETSDDTKNNQTSEGVYEKFSEVIKRGDETFVVVVTEKGPVEYVLPVEEPKVMEDKIFNEETSF